LKRKKECNKCLGVGIYRFIVNNKDVYISVCNRCNGTGKLDWIELILGTKSKRKTLQSVIIPKYNKEYRKRFKIQSYFIHNGLRKRILSFANSIIKYEEIYDSYEAGIPKPSYFVKKIM